MHSNAPAILFWTIAALVTAAFAVPMIHHMSVDAREMRSQEFQRLVGGLGLGPATDLARCPFSFDPRLGDACQADQRPIAGGAYFCPHHASSIFFYPQRTESL